MTILDVRRDPVTGHYDLHLRLTGVEAFDLARRILACAPEEPPAPPAPPEGDDKP